MIVIFFENSADVIRVNAGAPRCKYKAMAVIEAGRRATENGLRIAVAELMVRVHEHRRYPARPPVRNAGACSGLHHNGIFLFFYCSLHVSTVTNRHRQRQRNLGPEWLRCDKLPAMEFMLEMWSALGDLAGTGGRELNAQPFIQFGR